jgi:predicted metal-dependent peptidase
MTMTTRPVLNKISNRDELSPYVLRLMFDEPFFAHLIRILNIEFGQQIPTAGVMVKDGDAHLLINPDFISSLPAEQVKGLLKHECFHLIFNHCTDRALLPHIVGNIAADLAINCGIPAAELPEGGLLPGVCPKGMDGTPLGKAIASFPVDMAMEWYFGELMKNPEAKEQLEQMEQQPGFDDHGGWGEMSEDDKALVAGKIAEAAGRAVRDADAKNAWGTISASMRGKLREMVSKEVDWRSILKQFCGMSKRGTRSTTWSNVNCVHIDEKYGPLATGAKRGFTSSIAVYLDQSGSVGEKELALAFGEMRNLARRTEFTTFHFDTTVDEKSETVWKKSKVPATHRTRCGGTDFDCVTTHANKNRHRFDGYIIITDGEAGKPAPSKLKRCWMIVPDNKLRFTADRLDSVVQMKWPKGEK